MRGQPGHNIRVPPGFLGMDAWMTSQVNIALLRKLRGPLICLNFFFDMLSMDVRTTCHWQMSGLPMQELNIGCVVVLSHDRNISLCPHSPVTKVLLYHYGRNAIVVLENSLKVLPPYLIDNSLRCSNSRRR